MPPGACGRGGSGVLMFMHGRSRMMIDPRRHLNKGEGGIREKSKTIHYVFFPATTQTPPYRSKAQLSLSRNIPCNARRRQKQKQKQKVDKEGRGQGGGGWRRNIPYLEPLSKQGQNHRQPPHRCQKKAWHARQTRGRGKEGLVPLCARGGPLVAHGITKKITFVPALLVVSP